MWATLPPHLLLLLLPTADNLSTAAFTSTSSTFAAGSYGIIVKSISSSSRKLMSLRYCRRGSWWWSTGSWSGAPSTRRPPPTGWNSFRCCRTLLPCSSTRWRLKATRGSTSPTSWLSLSPSLFSPFPSNTSWNRQGLSERSIEEKNRRIKTNKQKILFHWNHLSNGQKPDAAQTSFWKKWMRPYVSWENMYLTFFFQSPTPVTFLIVRHPFDRILSAYRDKFERKNSYFHKKYGEAIVNKFRPSGIHRFGKEFYEATKSNGAPIKMDDREGNKLGVVNY